MVSIAGNTLQALARACAQELGPYSLTTTSAVSSAFTNLMLGGLADTEAPLERYGGRYAYLVDGAYAGQQSRVTRSGFVGATGSTTITPGINLLGAVQVASGVTIELHGTMPRIDQDGLASYRTCINRALRKLWTEIRFPITSTGAEVNAYDLGSLFWASRSRFKRLLDPDPGSSGHSAPSSVGWQVVQNGDVWTLELNSGFPSGDVFSLVAEAPLNARLYLNGAWANQASPTAGLVLDADACLGSWNHVFQASLYECMAALAVQAGGNRKAYWVGRAAEQRAVVSAIKLYQMETVETSLGEGPSASPGTDDPSKGLFSGGWGVF